MTHCDCHCQTWGSDGLPDPASVLADPPPVKGTKLADGRINCDCGATTDDNSSPGLKPSCSSCWRAIDLTN